MPMLLVHTLISSFLPSILCQCPIHLLATIDSQTMSPTGNVRNKFGLEEKSCKIYPVIDLKSM